MIYLLAAFAVYRVARMLALEDGPFDAFTDWRNWLGQASWIGRGFHCALCLSFWLAWVAALLVPYTSPADYILTALGIAGGAAFIYRMSL